MEIKVEHIKEAEELLIKGHKFDEERIPFIKNLQSCDLLAVPGSGKTTALLAKLYCLSKHLPFDDGSGVLILSHTNAAVDEIERNLKPYCPKLFEYPNFVGTVQSFVNKFLLIPYYVQNNGNAQIHVDGGIYLKSIQSYLARQQKGVIAYLKNKDYNLFVNARFWFDEDDNFIISRGISRDKIRVPVPQTWKNNNTVQQNVSKTEQYIIRIKKELFNKGILHYDDCYFTAHCYIKKYLQVRQILEQRFRYVFIDEMQDLEWYQIELIDKIFYHTNSSTIIQRIGDINQAIYNSGKMVKVEADWRPRNPMYLNGSNRLTIENAAIVNCFTLDRQQNENGTARFVVEGRKELTEIIKPHLILFEQQDKEKLAEKFRELIQQYKLEQTKEGKKYGFKIIGWNAKWEDGEEHNGKLRLEDIFTGYKKESSTNKENHDCLSKYLHFFDHNKDSLREAREAIMNALVAILRLEDKKATVKIRGAEVEKYYTKTNLLRHVQDDENGCDYQFFKNMIYKSSFSLAAKQDYETVYHDIKNFISNEFKDWFGLSLNKVEVSNFLGNEFEYFRQINSENPDEKEETVKIDIGTVHSAKGQTHCATMYVETAYQRSPYETNKVIKKNSNPFLLEEHKCNNKHDRQALKMMYVGFSRPTHLLCFAALKGNIVADGHDYETSIKPYKDKGWAVIDLTAASD